MDLSEFNVGDRIVVYNKDNKTDIFLDGKTGIDTFLNGKTGRVVYKSYRAGSFDRHHLRIEFDEDMDGHRREHKKETLLEMLK